MKNRWTLIGSLMVVALLTLIVGTGQAQGPDPQGDLGIQAALLGTAFTYQEQLRGNGEREERKEYTKCKPNVSSEYWLWAWDWSLC